MLLEVVNLKVKAEGKEVLKGVNLQVGVGETVALMGPNGSGKSSLAYSLLGLPNYQVSEGRVSLEGKDLFKMSVTERAKIGLFLGWQQPIGVKGVSLEQLLRTAVMSCKNAACERTGQAKKCFQLDEFRRELNRKVKLLKIEPNWLNRSINVKFSGGEKKKLEVLQLLMLKPALAILDEPDSGLDIDSLRVVSRGIVEAKKENPKLGLLLITHYQRLLKQVKPDRVVVMKAGQIVKEGGLELLVRLEKEGYAGFE
ncbi:MAG: Fe-S cluster assembly ATPase SufC [Candidatus Beckwithbacteria bacterium]